MKELTGDIYLTGKGFCPGKVCIEDGIISKIILDEREDIKVSDDGNKEIDANKDIKGNIRILPGLVDIHMHGANGSDFCDGTVDAIKAIDEYESKNGIVRFCMATMTLDENHLIKICNASREAIKGCKSFCGIYLEGPFLSLNRVGAQNSDYLRMPECALVNELNDVSGGLIKYVVIAPEFDGAIDVIKELSQKGIKCSIGHSEADYDVAKMAAEYGANHITHLYNAMPSLNHRNPGIVGMSFDEDDVEVELIADGIHVHPVVVRMTFDAKQSGKVILVSDSTMATGYADGIYHLGDKEIIVRNKCCYLMDEAAEETGNDISGQELMKGTLAGGAHNLYECMVNAIKMGVDYVSAIDAATINPAKSLGIDDMYGSIEIGKSGRLIVTDKEYNIIDILS